jgi:hypothetical protein
VSARWSKTTNTDDLKDLVAITFEGFGDEMIFPSQGMAKRAIIRGYSFAREASFRFNTGYLPAARQTSVQRLGLHGFTVVRLPRNWQYGFSSDVEWQNELIIEAVNRVNALPAPMEGAIKGSGYDAELADAVLESLNEAFPTPISLIALKHQLREEPTDTVLSSALNALRGDGFVDGTPVHENPRLNPLEILSLTREGRRHIEEMKRKKAPLTNGYTVNEASQFILAELLAEFRERNLTANDLRNTYEGLPPDALKTRSIERGIHEVDYELGMSDLIGHNLVKTGPIVPIENDPHSSFVLIAWGRSENKYSYLTEEGYREAVKASTTVSSTDKQKSRHVHISGTFHNSPIGVGDGFAQTVIAPMSSLAEVMAAFRSEVPRLIEDEAKRREVLSRLDELESATDKPSLFERYNNLVATIGSHISVFSFLLPPLMDKLMK